MIYQAVSDAETKTFTLALGQMRVIGGEVSGNLARAEAMAEEATHFGIDLLLLPEVLDCGWCDQSARQHAGAIPGGTSYEALAAAAVKNQIHLCAGLTERDGELIYNAAVLIGPDGKLLLKHRKVNELAIAKDLYSTGGSAAAVCATPLGSIGLLICADAFFPGEALTRALAAQGAQVILSPCAWAVPPEHDQEREPYGALWRDVYGRPAREHGLWIAGASNVGMIRHGKWSGHPCIGASLLVGPDGGVRASGPFGSDAEEVIVAPVTIISGRRS